MRCSTAPGRRDPHAVATSTRARNTAAEVTLVRRRENRSSSTPDSLSLGCPCPPAAQDGRTIICYKLGWAVALRDDEEAAFGGQLVQTFFTFLLIGITVSAVYAISA